MSITDAAKRERAWFRRQKGYIRDEFTRSDSAMNKRVTVLEVLLQVTRPRAELASFHAASGAESMDFYNHDISSADEPCLGCISLRVQRPDLNQQTLEQIHNLHLSG